MRQTKAERTARLFASLTDLGFDYAEIQRLKRIESTLRRWSERECGDSNDYGSWAIERDETTGKPYEVRHHYRHGQGKDSMTRTAIPDRETGALKQLAAIMADHPALWSYHQGDPRGCALYLGKRSDLPKLTSDEIARFAGEHAAKTPASRFRAVIDSYYGRGLAVCL